MKAHIVKNVFPSCLSPAVVGLIWLVFGLAPIHAQETADFFKRNCANCHTIGGGRLIGPDLKNVGQRRDKEWLTRFMLNPKATIDSGDAYAQQLLNDYSGVLMPTTPDLTAERAEHVLKLIDTESALERSQFASAAAAIPDRPFTDQEVANGWELFVGFKSLKSGGAACISCHSTHGVSALGGGRLGPDLTGAWNKLQGRKGLAAWLSSPPTPTMQPIYKAHPLASEEILEMVAYLESIKDERAEASVARFNFFLLGLAGTAGGFVMFDYIWKRRFRGVRRPLIHGEEKRDE